MKIYAVIDALRAKPLDAIRFALGVFILIFGLIRQNPSPSELELFSGALVGFASIQDCSFGRCKTERVLVLGAEHRRFRNDAVTKSNVTEFNKPDSTIAIYIEKNRSIPLSRAGDAEKSWGFTFNGEEIESLDAALLKDNFLLHIALPLLGALLIALSFPWRVLYQKDNKETAAKNA